MDEEIERLVVSVRADTRGFARDVAAMRAEMDGPFAAGIEKAGRALESSLVRAIQTGKFGFEDLRRVAMSVLSEIAATAIRSGIDSILGGGGGQSSNGGLFASLGAILGGALGLPGRATGGPVAPGRAYRVGERGPELFVPTSNGRIEASSDRAVSTTVNVHIRVSDNGRMSAPKAIQRSSRQVARAVRDALARAED